MARATTTVLFTDLVGSTEQAVRWGTAFDEARRAHDAALRAVVRSHHGHVVKGTGDGVMATFASVADGVAAARAAQQAIHRLNARRPPPELHIRVGLAVGDVSMEDGDCYGEAVVQAARLCDLAAGDQVLATAVVQALVGGSRAPGFAHAGAKALKGLPEAVDTVAVEWDRPEASATPLPARLLSEATTFVGRHDELEVLDVAYRAASGEEARRVVLVGGEPGVGKTTVVAQAARRWFDAGAMVAMGRCEEDVRAPYRPIAEALQHLVAHAPDALLRDHVVRHGRGVLPLVPALADRVGPLPAPAANDLETDRFLLFAAVSDLLAALGQVAPVVLVLDDLHWADAATVSLLRSLAADPDPARLVVVGTLRSDELAADHPMGQALAAFRRVPAVQRVALGGLGRGDVVDLVERWTGTSDDTAERLADVLLAETGGNAFFVTEVVRHLDEGGRLADGAAEGRELVPDSVREFLGERIARLGSVGDSVLAAAAVIGDEFTLPLVAEVTGLADEKVLEVLADAAASSLVREVPDAPGRFVFLHALVQHATLALLGPTRAAALHRRVAEVLEAGAPGDLPAARLAHHWLQATNVSDTGRARDWAREAGDAAVAALAPADAVAFYRQAVVLNEQVRGADPAVRIDLLTQLGTAERQAGDPEHRETLLRACRLAQRADDTDRLVAAALANNSGTFSRFQGMDHERIGMLEAALAAIGPVGSDDRRALLLGTLANELTYSGDYARRRELAEGALRSARATGNPGLLVRVANLAFYPLWVPDTLPERLALTEESLAALPVAGDPLARFWTSQSGLLNLVQAGRVADAAPLLDAICEQADRLAQPALRWRALHTEAAWLLLAGDPDAAEPIARAALDVGDRAGEPEATVYWKSQELVIRWQRSTLDALSARIKGTAPRPPNATASLALVFAETGREPEAAALLDALAERGLVDVPIDPAYVSFLALSSEAAARLGHEAAATLLYQRVLPLADQVAFDGVMALGGLRHHLGALAGVLGRPEEAAEHLRAAIDLHRHIGAPFFEARSRCALAAVAPGGSARAEAEAALALARDRGYPGIERWAAGLLARPGT
jgi:class 3 adenylate cyclase/tetratricopeptide (TPR) repeat protein